MKKLIAVSAAGLISIVSMLASAGIIYPQAYRVAKVDYRNDTITIASRTGYTYTIEGAEDWTPGDICACIMYNNGTPRDISDDQVISYRYSGL